MKVAGKSFNEIGTYCAALLALFEKSVIFLFVGHFNILVRVVLLDNVLCLKLQSSHLSLLLRTHII